MAGVAQSDMSPCSMVELCSKPHKKKGRDGQAKRLATVDISSTGKTAAKREQNRLAAAKCRARKRSNIENYKREKPRDERRRLRVETADTDSSGRA